MIDPAPAVVAYVDPDRVAAQQYIEDRIAGGRPTANIEVGRGDSPAGARTVGTIRHDDTPLLRKRGDSRPQQGHGQHKRGDPNELHDPIVLPLEIAFVGVGPPPMLVRMTPDIATSPRAWLSPFGP
jgi:hypothetical protein